MFLEGGGGGLPIPEPKWLDLSRDWKRAYENIDNLISYRTRVFPGFALAFRTLQRLVRVAARRERSAVPFCSIA